MSDIDFSLDDILEYVSKNYPEYCVVKVDDYESTDSNETYKFLYDKLSSNHSKTVNDLFNITTDYQQLEIESAKLSEDLKKERELNAELNLDSKTFIEFIKKYLESDVYVSDVVVDGTGSYEKNVELFSISENPGIYNFKRPSWFTLLQSELSKEAVYKNSSRLAKSFLKFRSLFNKNVISSGAISKFALKYDSQRMKKIADILLSSVSNENKYLQYLMMSPGISVENRDLIFAASDLGLDANIIIELFEQPKESFNIEVIKMFVSKLRKGTEYNLKQELAEELIQGKWNIRASVNGTEQLFQLVPIDDIKKVVEKLKNLIDGLNVPESSSDDIESVNDVNYVSDEEKYPYIYEDISTSSDEDSGETGLVNFDESMI